jgi:hypothetical protein
MPYDEGPQTTAATRRLRPGWVTTFGGDRTDGARRSTPNAGGDAATASGEEWEKQLPG